MANHHRSAAAILLLITLTLFSHLPLSISTIPYSELTAALDALRHRGYNLFPNSILLSDLLHTIISSSSSSNFTLLSPPDPSLFSLDMSSSSADHYLSSLRFHLVPDRRFSIQDLREISRSDSPFVKSMVDGTVLEVSIRRRGGGGRDGGTGEVFFDDVVVEGVRISNPDVYLGPNVAVHGLDGAISVASMAPESGHGGLGFVPPPLPHFHSFSSPSSRSGSAAPIPPVSISPGTDSAWFLAPESQERDSVPPISPILPSPAVAEPSPSPVASVAVVNPPPFDLSSILPLDWPLISPETLENSTSAMPNPWSPPAESLESVNGSKNHKAAHQIPFPGGSAGTSPHQLTQPAVGSPPPPQPIEEVMPELEMPDRYNGPPWNSWTELIRDFAAAQPPAFGSVGGYGGKRSNVGMKGGFGQGFRRRGRGGGVRGRIDDDDYGYGTEDFDPVDVNAMLHA